MVNESKIETRVTNRDFPGGPLIKTSPSNVGAAVLSLVRELRSHMPRDQNVPKHKTDASIVMKIQ